MRFEGEISLAVILITLAGTCAITTLLPSKTNARAYILVIVHYFFFLPSVVYLAFNDHQDQYIYALIIAVACVYLGSAIPIKRIAVPELRQATLLSVVLFLIILALFLQAAFGGLAYINFDMESVYEFRDISAANMPAIFGYVFSNVANVLIPSSIVLALHLRSKALAITGVASGIFLFGMSHHKSVVFVALMVFGLYIVMKRVKSPPLMALLPVSLIAVCAIEIIYYQYMAPSRHVGFITSYIMRRTLLVPPMLDVAAVELFSETAKYYWSTSRLGLGIASNPHGLAAPFLMGTVIFNDTSMSANPGNIGSGYSNAGLFGVFLYSIVTGLVISFINAVGNKVGHQIVAAISTPVILIVLTSTDLTTAILSHGLLALIILLLFLPKQVAWAQKLNQKAPKWQV